MNSLVDFNIGGHITIKDSEISHISTCGGILKNTNPSIVNTKPEDEAYTSYIN
jgi:hypothetical protein